MLRNVSRVTLQAFEPRAAATIISNRSIYREPSVAVWQTALSLSSSRCIQAQARGFATSESSSDTIYALATPPGVSAIAVIRISGPGVRSVFSKLSPTQRLPKPRFAAVRELYSTESPVQASPEVLDPSALVLYFPGPNSSTGEDVLELHIHGGRAIIRCVLKAISNCSTRNQRVRHAEPGEFTKRAFLNRKLDLTQAEALGSILAAETEQQRRTAVVGTRGGAGKIYDDWRLQLVEARGELEALIDFAEDQQFEETPEKLVGGVLQRVKRLKVLVENSARNAMRGELLRNGIRLTVIGKPNAGKSSLLNAIVGRDAAIVSSVAGTTRDVVEVSVDIGGWLVNVGDTAGLRSMDNDDLHNETASLVDPIEVEGMRRALTRARSSDVVLVLLCIEMTSEGPIVDLDPQVMMIADRCIQAGGRIVVAVNKIDLIPAIRAVSVDDEQLRAENTDLGNLKIVVEKAVANHWEHAPVAFISCKRAVSGTYNSVADSGVQSLLRALTLTFEDLTSALAPESITFEPSNKEAPDMSFWQESLGATERQRKLLEECVVHLNEFLDSLQSSHETAEDMDVVLAAEHLRNGAHCLAKVTGREQVGDVEEVLGVVFEKYFSCAIL